jgi:NADPH2:quinone reductase
VILQDTIVDYRHGPEKMKADVQAALGSLEAFHAFDCISSKGTWIPITQMVAPNGGQVSVVSGANAYDEAEIPGGVKIKYVYVGTAHDGAYIATMPKQPADKEASESAIEFAYVFFRYLTRMLAKGTYEGHPYEVIPGGLNGVGEGLQRLKSGQSHGNKFVYRIEETPGLERTA